MEIKEFFQSIENKLEAYKKIIGVMIILLLIIGIVSLYISENKVKKLAQKCGYNDGKIRCVCKKIAYDRFISQKSGNQNLEILTKDLNS